MSTSIDGVRFEPGTDAFTVARLLREHLAPVAVRLELAEVMSQAVRAVDTSDARGLDRPIEAAWSAVKEVKKATENGYDPARCFVWVGADPTDDTHRVHVALNAHSDLVRAAEAIPGASEYSFGNSSDWTPDGVSRADYLARKEVWDRVIPSGMPLVDMLQVQIRAPYDSTVADLFRNRRATPEPLLDVAPPLASRAHDVAFHLLLDACQAADPDASVGSLTGRLFFGQPRHVKRAVADVLDPDLPAALIADDLDRSPAPDLTAARDLAAAWVADGMPDDPIDED